jgi:hypothetical protein
MHISLPKLVARNKRSEAVLGLGSVRDISSSVHFPLKADAKEMIGNIFLA